MKAVLLAAVFKPCIQKAFHNLIPLNVSGKEKCPSFVICCMDIQ